MDVIMFSDSGTGDSYERTIISLTELFQFIDLNYDFHRQVLSYLHRAIFPSSSSAAPLLSQ